MRFPQMRDYVIDALRSLADVDHQRVVWGRYEEGVRYYDDLTLNVHVLYDDCQVVPEPSTAVGAVLFEHEVPAFTALHAALDPMIDDLQDASDDVYITDPRWPDVVAAAAAALVVMGAAG
ncbi:hypothetical protein [Cellulomonas sp. SLBN-39]|uniref:SCO4402 family protein n=1 Tax=Cellulomonas sp. SLBN-39 TaxID=2768446 RepID=UPI001153D8F5|nr:hypothetical protein [Cellulomonas sp. SLBN-39]